MPCDQPMNRRAVRPAHKNFLSDIWRQETYECSPAHCMHVGDQMSFDHQPLSSFIQRGRLQPLMSDGQCQSSPQAAMAESGASPTQNPLVPCVYIALRCSHCGELRQALAAPPSASTAACPECARICSFVLLGSGLTKRALPCHEIHPAGQTRWDGRSDETSDSDKTDDDT
jgi:hypothetical protein